MRILVMVIVLTLQAVGYVMILTNTPRSAFWPSLVGLALILLGIGVTLIFTGRRP